MAIRNSHRVGDHLLLDDESGFVIYKSEAVKLWNGTWVHHSQFETRQPQEFVRAGDDPKALREIRPEPKAAAVVNSVSGLVGSSTVVTRTSPAGHLFKPGVGRMIIEGDNPNTRFVVS